MASEAAVVPGREAWPRTLGWVLDYAPGLLFAAALALYAVRLGDPPRYIYDEVYHSYTAGEIARGNTDALVWWTKTARPGMGYTWNHPPVGVLLLTGGVLLWGDHSYGWRFPSAVFGALGVALAFLLARALTGDRRVALLAALVLLMDGLWFVQSRAGMLDMFGAVFMLGAFLALHRWMVARPEAARGPLLALGLGVGLAMATKWNAVYASGLIGLVVLGRTLALAAVAAGRRGAAGLAGLGGDPDPERARAGLRAHLAWGPVGLVALPAAVYVAAYIPFFAAGNGFAQFLEQQWQTWRYHAGLHATHAYQSAWWQWPLALRPVWYYHGSFPGGRVADIYANLNPVLAWGMLPAVAWLVARWWRERRAAALVVALGFFGQWLPWALVPRIAFAYHFLPPIPFGCVAVGVWIATQVRRGGVPRLVAVAWLAAIVAAFAWFYPIWSGVPIPREAFEQRLWLKSWR